MAIASVGTIGTAQSKTSGTTLTITTTATAEARNLVMLAIALNNTGTTDADHSEIASISDSGSNAWTKVREYTNGQGAEAAGATVSLYYSILGAQISSGGTITVTFANSIIAKAASAWDFTVTTGIRIDAGTEEAVDAGTPGALALSGLANAEHLFFRAWASEGSTSTVTPTGGYTAISQDQTSGGGAETNMAIRGEFRVVTATGQTSDPDQLTSRDLASVFASVSEIPPVWRPRPGSAGQEARLRR